MKTFSSILWFNYRHCNEGSIIIIIIISVGSMLLGGLKVSLFFYTLDLFVTAYDSHSQSCCEPRESLVVAHVYDCVHGITRIIH